MAKRKKTEKQIEQYEHSNKKRANNPPVGLVTPKSDPDTGEKKTYEYDPHLDPQLQWTGKAEHNSFEVPTFSLHVHERIDPKTIIDTVTKETVTKEKYSGTPMILCVSHFVLNRECKTLPLLHYSSLLIVKTNPIYTEFGTYISL